MSRFQNYWIVDQRIEQKKEKNSSKTKELNKKKRIEQKKKN
jgi:hypothetical protein